MTESNAPDSPPLPTDEPDVRPGGLPLYLWVVLAVALAVPVGLALGAEERWAGGLPKGTVPALRTALELAPKLIIRALGAIAAPLVVLAVLSTIVTNEVRGRQGVRMMLYYLLNTTFAMIVGLALSNLFQPGKGANLGEAPTQDFAPKSLVDVLTELVPRSIGDAFAQNNLAQLVLLTIALAIGLTRIRDQQRARGETSYRTVVDLVTLGFELLMKVLLWIVALVPIAVFGVVASSIARDGFEVFLNLGWFILVVLIGLTCQVALYLLEVGLLGRTSPVRFLRASADVVATTFSTASTAATIPFTLRALIDKLGLSKASSQLAACVGTNFNNDGTALYQAAAALFFAQALGRDLPLASQIVIVLTTLVASVGAGGVPSGSFVTMPLIFAAVDLPADQLPILLTIDWFLDRCRTTSNVLGDMTVAVLLDRTEPTASSAPD